MRVLVTGQVGLDKGEYLEQTGELIRARGREYFLESIGQRMVALYKGTVTEKTILNLPRALLGLLRRYAWSKVIEDVGPGRRGPDDVVVVSSHSVFRWYHGLFPAIDEDLVCEFEPDIIVTLIDDVDDVVRRLHERDANFSPQLWEVLAWREEETWFTHYLRESVQKLVGHPVGFYVLPRKQGAALLAKILTEPNAKKAYMSFPMTTIGALQAKMSAGQPQQNERLKRVNELAAEVKEFKAAVEDMFVAFDPAAMTERGLIGQTRTVEGDLEAPFAAVADQVKKLMDAGVTSQPAWVASWGSHSSIGLVDFDFSGQQLHGAEVTACLAGIDSQIISRDYLLIDQSDFVITYILIGEDGQPVISAGCQSEMLYAYAQGKPVYVVCSGGPESLSPWVTEFCTVFLTTEEALAFLRSNR
jgi:adenylate kinase